MMNKYLYSWTVLMLRMWIGRSYKNLNSTVEDLSIHYIPQDIECLQILNQKGEDEMAWFSILVRLYVKVNCTCVYKLPPPPPPCGGGFGEGDHRTCTYSCLRSTLQVEVRLGRRSRLNNNNNKQQWRTE